MCSKALKTFPKMCSAVYVLPPSSSFFLSVVEDWWRTGEHFPKGVYTTAPTFRKALSSIRYRIARALRVPVYCVEIDPSDVELA